MTPEENKRLEHLGAKSFRAARGDCPPLTADEAFELKCLWEDRNIEAQSARDAFQHSRGKEIEP